MADTYTSRLRLLLQENLTNSNVWGKAVNDSVIQLVEQALSGRTTIDVTFGDATLQSMNGSIDETRSMFLDIEGIPGTTRTVIVPGLQKLYVIRNATDPGFDVTIRTAAGTGITLSSGETVICFVSEDLNDVVTLTTLGGDVVLAGTRFTRAVDIVAGTAVAGDDTTDIHFTIQGDQLVATIEPFSTQSGVGLTVWQIETDAIAEAALILPAYAGVSDTQAFHFWGDVGVTIGTAVRVPLVLVVTPVDGGLDNWYIQQYDLSNVGPALILPQQLTIEYTLAEF